jgi:16S rRNA (cytosine967-C5)-methyltransferase
MKNKGRILACDTSASRLAQLEKRMRRAGVHNTTAVAIASEQDSYLKRHRSSADCVLVDAPCSGSGTWRRNPDLKWRLSPESLEELMRLQQNILMQASRLVKPGGRLVYATCSLLQEENERQLQNFTQNCQDFRVASLGKIWNNLGSGLDGQQGTVMKTTPCKHQMDGFFAAVLVREPSSSPLPAGDNQPVT